MWMRGLAPKARHRYRRRSASKPLSANTVRMRAMTAKAARNSRSKASVSLCVGRRGGASDRNAVPVHRDVVLGAQLRAVRRVGAGEVTAALGAHRAAVQDQVGVAAQHADQQRMHPRQQARPGPVRQAAPQSRAADLVRCRQQAAPGRALAQNCRKVASTRTVAAGGWPRPCGPRCPQHSITVAIRPRILPSNTALRAESSGDGHRISRPRQHGSSTRGSCGNHL